MKKINQLDRFSPGILQSIGFIVIAISMVMVFLIPGNLFSILITISITFAILLLLISYRNLRLFLIAALVEHIIIIITLSAIVYTEPPLKKNLNNATVKVDIILPSPEKEPKKSQSSIPQVAQSNIKLPSLKTRSAITEYLSSSEDDVISSIPSRSRSYKLSPGGLATGNLDKITGQTAGKESNSDLTIKDIRTPKISGEYKPSSRFNLPSEGSRKPSYGRVGPTGRGRVATGSSIEYSDKVKKGSGLFQITGEVEGRRVTYWPEVPEVKGREVGAVVLKFWVNPEGEVSNVIIKRKAGDPLLEKKAKEFVEQLRFARLPSSVEQKLQKGEITIDFTTKEL